MLQRRSFSSLMRAGGHSIMDVGGTETNSQDPLSIESRVFVGHLNTANLNKLHLERIFGQYGPISGISVHKGYAFIQYMDPYSARSACIGEDGRSFQGSTWDVNMAAEPKDKVLSSHKTTKRQPVRGGLFASMRGVKKRRVDFTNTRAVFRTPKPSTANNGAVAENSTTSSQLSPKDDILICGKCREIFYSLTDFTEHQTSSCVPPTCEKCAEASTSSDENLKLQCATCGYESTSAWDLCQHAQSEHFMAIYVVANDDDISAQQDTAEIRAPIVTEETF